MENAGVENEGVESRGGKCRSGKCRRDDRWKAVKTTSIRYQFKLNRNGFRQSVNNAHELRTGMQQRSPRTTSWLSSLQHSHHTGAASVLTELFL